MANFDLTKYLAEGKLLKEEVDYSSIKGEMKKIYDIDVDLDTIKDFVTSYDDGEGMDVFDTTEREDFYLYLKDEGKLLKEDNLRDYWSEWAAGEVEVGNENVIDAGGVDAEFEKVGDETMNTFKDYVKAVKALNADSKELRNDIAGAVSSILYDGGDFEDYTFNVLTADQFTKIQDII